jgi:hypothetical protein
VFEILHRKAEIKKQHFRKESSENGAVDNTYYSAKLS